MVLTEDERKERNRKYNKKYYENNKEKCKIMMKNYEQNNKDERKKYFKEHNKTPNRKKMKTISKWKQRGLVCEDYDSLYCHYLTANECDNCNIIFGEKGDGTQSFKCMDHCHQTGLFRNFLCSSCNFKRK